jgi:hypothetical protein
MNQLGSGGRHQAMPWLDILPILLQALAAARADYTPSHI